MQKINPPCSHAPCPCVRISLSLLHTLYSKSCSFSMLSEICRVSFFFSENWLLQLLSEIWLLVKLLSELWRPAGELSWARSSCGNPPFGVVTTLISALWQLQKNSALCLFGVVTTVRFQRCDPSPFRADTCDTSKYTYTLFGEVRLSPG